VKQPLFQQKAYHSLSDIFKKLSVNSFISYFIFILCFISFNDLEQWLICLCNVFFLALVTFNCLVLCYGVRIVMLQCV